MNVSLLSLATVLTLLVPAASASDDLLLLTPMNAQDYGYWVRCTVKDKKADGRNKPEQRTQPASVIFRLGLIHDGRLHKGPFAVNQKDLQVIKSISLVVRDGKAVLLDVPLRTVVDAGNNIHLLAEFFAQRETVSGMQVVFEEHGGSETQSIAIDLKRFIGQP